MATPKLRAYRAKRDFSKTAEPAARPTVGGDGGNRFVVHKHHATADHYDLQAAGRRRAEELGGAERALAQPGRQAAGGRDRGPSARIYRLRGRHSRRRIWRRADDRLGHRRVGADGRCREEPVDRRLQVPAGRRQAEWRLDAGAAEAASRARTGARGTGCCSRSATSPPTTRSTSSTARPESVKSGRRIEELVEKPKAGGQAGER